MRKRIKAEIHWQFYGDLNTVEFFARAVTAHRTRYSQKLERIRFEHPEARAEQQIARIADGEIPCARAAGRVSARCQQGRLQVHARGSA